MKIFEELGVSAHMAAFMDLMDHAESKDPYLADHYCTSKGRAYFDRIHPQWLAQAITVAHGPGILQNVYMSVVLFKWSCDVYQFL